MPKITEQEFDSLFRQAASGIFPEHGAEDWEDMQRRLEVVERDARARNISLYAMLGILLLYSLFMPENLNLSVYDRASLVASSEQRVSETGPAASELKLQPAQLSETSRSEGQNPDPSALATSARELDSHTGLGHAEVVQDRRPVVAESAKRVVAAAGMPAEPEQAQTEMRLFGVGSMIASRQLQVPSTDRLSASVQVPTLITSTLPGKITKVEYPVRHPWFVKVAISPDFSSIDYGGAGETGLNFGPMVEYGISPRWSMSTGVIWSKKLYDQTDPGKSYGQGGYTIHANLLSGDCRILDIPLNLTYYLLPGRKTNLFVTVGSSSYIMLEEEYVYTVSRNNRDYEYVENYSNENHEWFSMLNLSVGVQQQVGKRWFVQAEPFLKSPMKGIGEGKVNLVSAGVFMSVKYSINP